MKVATVSKKNTFVPVTIAITFESQKEMNDFIEGVKEAEEYDLGIEVVIGSIKEELSK